LIGHEHARHLCLLVHVGGALALVEHDHDLEICGRHGDALTNGWKGTMKHATGNDVQHGTGRSASPRS